MSDFSIKPPGPPGAGVGAKEVATGSTPVAESGARPFELDPTAAPARAHEAAPASPVEPSALVQRIRAGEIDVDRAVEILIDQALAAQPFAPESLRREMRQALTELVRDDPTLAALASAMRR